MFGVLLWISSLLWSEIISPLCVHVFVFVYFMNFHMNVRDANAMADFITIHVWFTESICFVWRLTSERKTKTIRMRTTTCVRILRPYVHVWMWHVKKSNCPMTIRTDTQQKSDIHSNSHWQLIVLFSICSFFLSLSIDLKTIWFEDRPINNLFFSLVSIEWKHFGPCSFRCDSLLFHQTFHSWILCSWLQFEEEEETEIRIKLILGFYDLYDVFNHNHSLLNTKKNDVWKKYEIGTQRMTAMISCFVLK